MVLHWRILIVVHLWLSGVSAETTWVWNTNRTPQGSAGSANSAATPQNANFGEVNFGRDRQNSKNGQASIFPDSPSRPSSSSKQDSNGALPADSIRLVNNGNSEARLIPGAANFVSSALQSIGGGGGGGGGSGGGLFSIGGNLIGSLFQTVPQIAGSAFEILLGRPSKGNGNSGSGSSSGSSRPSSSGATTLPASASGTVFPILTPGGGGGNRNPGSSSGNSGNCRCIPLNNCYLPNQESGSCSGGNIMCCPTTTRTRSILDDQLPAKQSTRDSKPTKSDSEGAAESGTDVRLGLLENIVKGGSNVVDDALDLLLLRYYTDEDQQRLKNRVLKSG